MKDIVNPHMREALERLERAIGRLDAAAARAPSEDAEALREELERVRRDHAALSTSAAHVADRLDVVIGQVRSMLDE